MNQLYKDLDRLWELTILAHSGIDQDHTPKACEVCAYIQNDEQLKAIQRHAFSGVTSEEFDALFERHAGYIAERVKLWPSS